MTVQKRLIVQVELADHVALMRKARDAGSTLANFVRERLGLPLERQGIKSTPGQKRKAAAK